MELNKKSKDAGAGAIAHENLSLISRTQVLFFFKAGCSTGKAEAGRYLGLCSQVDQPNW